METDNRRYKQKIQQRWLEMKTERQSWIEHWKEVSEFIIPRSGRFTLSDRNKGYKKNESIKDNTATKAWRVLGAGMMSGAMSPARQWFKAGTNDPDLNEYKPMQLWLDNITNTMNLIFQRSNTYRTAHNMFEEMGAFGTSVSIILPNERNIIHHHGLTAGEYALDVDPLGNVDCMYREFERTVRSVVTEFGYKNCSNTVKRLYDRGNLGAWIPIVHYIEPRTDRDIRKTDVANMGYTSNYFETGTNENTFLREGGFRNFPCLCPRWALNLGDIYGHSPAMDALNDIQSLQNDQEMRESAIDYMVNPPLQVSSLLKGRSINRLPGGITFTTGADPAPIKSAYDVKIDLSYLIEGIQDTRGRINASFYADLFMMLANITDSRMTATEVAERHEEKLLMLGPVIERIHNEMLSPLIDITFNYMIEAGLVPPAPEEAEGQELNIEFISLLAQAQKAVAVNSIDKYITTMGAVAQAKPDILDKLNEDYLADSYGSILGVDPKMIRTNEEATEIRQKRADMQAEQQKNEALLQQSQSMKNIADAQQAEQSGDIISSTGGVV